MTCIMEAHTNPYVNAKDEIVFPVKAVAELQTLKSNTSRNVFTVSHASIHPDAAAATDFLDKNGPHRRKDMELQRITVKNHHLVKLREFVEKNEMESAMSEEERVIAIKCLVHRAAEHDMEHAHRLQYPQEIIHFMRRTWQVLLQQVQAHLHDETSLNNNSLNNNNNNNNCPPTPPTTTALENISGLGLWFTGAMSLPLRRYALQLPAPDGTLQDIIAVGLVNFAYAAYVMDSRRRAQQATLAELERLSRRLAVKLLFLPPLILPEEPATAQGEGEYGD